MKKDIPFFLLRGTGLGNLQDAPGKVSEWQHMLLRKPGRYTFQFQLPTTDVLVTHDAMGSNSFSLQSQRLACELCTAYGLDDGNRFHMSIWETAYRRLERRDLKKEKPES